MKLLFLSLFLFALSNFSFSQTKQYVFFFHNKFIEDAGINASHPEYGKAEYHQIIETFKKEKFIVLSEIRPKNTDAETYADKIVKQIDSLIKLGIKASQVNVVGTSKGGYIAMYVSSKLQNPEIKYMFIGCCNNHANMPINFSGKILSIYEKSDDIGLSCSTFKNNSKNKLSDYQEIQLNTGLKHGFLYKALKDWLNPCIKWIRK